MVLDLAHPLAGVAARRCGGRHARRVLVGGVACRECWRRAVDDDRAVAVVFGLDPTPPAVDPDLVDEIAVELACRGARVGLTPVEFRVALDRLRGEGVGPAEIEQRLGATEYEVRAGRRVAGRTFTCGWCGALRTVGGSRRLRRYCDAWCRASARVEAQRGARRSAGMPARPYQQRPLVRAARAHAQRLGVPVWRESRPVA